MSLEIRIWRFIRGFYFRAGRRLQFMIIRTDVFKMSVLHSKSLWNCAQLDKAQSLIQMAGVNIAFYNSIELKNSIATFFCLKQAVFYKLFTNMFSAGIGSDGIACITDVTAASNIVWMKDVKSINFATFFCNTR